MGLAYNEVGTDDSNRSVEHEAEADVSRGDDDNQCSRQLILSGKPPTPASPRREFLRSKFRIGSCKGEMNFGRKQAVFSSDAMPLFKKENADAVRLWKREHDAYRADYVPKWNQSSLPADIICHRRTRANSEHDRGNAYCYNFRAEVLPPKNLIYVPPPSKWHVSRIPPKTANAVLQARTSQRLLDQPPSVSGAMKRTQEMPVHPRFQQRDFAGVRAPWRPESRSVTRGEAKARAVQATAAAKRSSDQRKKSLKPDRYATPEERHRSYQAQVRVLKRTGYTAAFDAAVYHQFNIPKHNRNAIEPSRKYRTFEHSGVYEYNDIEKNWMWSDTGSFEKASPGDIVKSHDPGAYNLASPSNN